MAAVPAAAFAAAFDACYRRVAAAAPLPPCAPDARGGVGFDVLFAAHLGAHAKWARKTAWRHRTPAAIAAFAAAYAEGSSITALAAAPGVNASPFLLARALVEALLGVPRAAVGALVREPRLRIADARLAAEVAAAAEADAHCSPYVDRLRAWAGDEGEWRLAAGLAARGLAAGDAWLSEEHLRARGAARTPDALLRWPIVVACPYAPSRAAHAHALCWLDSKALFFDAHARGEAAPQLEAYGSLYGAGAVVAWGGFVAELEPCCVAGGEDGGCESAAGPRPSLAALIVAPARGPLLLTALPREWRWATEEEVRAARCGGGDGGAVAAGSPAPAPALVPTANDDAAASDSEARPFNGALDVSDAETSVEPRGGHERLLLERPPGAVPRNALVACVGPIKHASEARLARLAALAKH